MICSFRAALQTMANGINDHDAPEAPFSHSWSHAAATMECACDVLPSNYSSHIHSCSFRLRAHHCWTLLWEGVRPMYHLGWKHRSMEATVPACQSDIADCWQVSLDRAPPLPIQQASPRTDVSKAA